MKQLRGNLVVDKLAADPRWLMLGGTKNLVNLDDVEFREYQLNIIKSIYAHGNTLVVLPTGLGKTFIGISIIANTLSSGKKSMILAPTKPLAEQHYATVSRFLKVPKENVLLLTGTISKKLRSEQENSAEVIIATPQTVANDLRKGLLSIDGFGSVIFDECHRAVGKYAYTYVANECIVRNVLVVGLTASPGSKRERINELVGSLGIRHIEARTSYDRDVVNYVMQKNIHIVYVDIGDRINAIAGLLRPEMDASLKTLNSMGLLRFKLEFMPKGRLIDLGNQIRQIQAPNYRMGAMAAYSKLLNLNHAYDLVLTEGIGPFLSYMNGLYAKDKKSRSIESLLKSQRIIAARELAIRAIGAGEEHPKVYALVELLEKNAGRKAMVFAQYRSTVKMLTEHIRKKGIKAEAFVGKKEGVTQEEQKRVIQSFREGNFDVLVASSIGEEGIDIPGVDIVIFYEPIPNEIRNIQRRGRTGRSDVGEVYIIVARGTRDQIYLRISQQREEKMMSLIKIVNASLEAKLGSEPKKQSRL